MAIKFDRSSAEEKLIEAFKNKGICKDENSDSIIEILNGTHKTYKYILVTALLAKACNNKINPLALQAGAPIDGAYDARSLCHKVLVPFERNFLSNALGGSNEPFLNKPARFTHLSMENAVRAGSDKKTLSKLIQVLSSINTSELAAKYLAFSLAVILDIAKEQSKLNEIPLELNPTLLEIYDFINHFISKSNEGETCAIIVGALEKIYHLGLKEDFTVICHKVNQSGASSKEIGDIDVFKRGNYCHSIEVKDKTFTVYDVEHALNKIIENKGTKGAFIFGPRAPHNYREIRTRLLRFEKEKFLTIFMDIRTYSKILLFQSNIAEKRKFFEIVISTANEINAKDETKKWIHEVIKELKLDL